MSTLPLFDDALVQPLSEGAAVLRRFAAERADTLLADLQAVLAQAPWRHMVTPGGHRMSVAMTNCGDLGWVADSTGYRYVRTDPMTGRPWPAMPLSFVQLATDAAAAADFGGFVPDACLANRYEPKAKLSLHQDKDEYDHGHPIVSVSLGIPAVFLFGGRKRSDPTARVVLAHGDVVVWGGPARLHYHGVLPLAPGWHPAVGNMRVNLTLRKAGPATNSPADDRGEGLRRHRRAS
jgi:alkylated DNA repair protein (DNA oxidative demethylase)